MIRSRQDSNAYCAAVKIVFARFNQVSTMSREYLQRSPTIQLGRSGRFTKLSSRIGETDGGGSRFPGKSRTKKESKMIG